MSAQAPRRPPPPGSVLLVDKQAGRSSHAEVAGVRRQRGGRRAVKVGHAGTLDPFATGLLLVLLGRATRVQRWLMALPKTYEVVARLGWTSTTGDPEGELAETGVVPPDDGRTLPTGRLRQRPPAYSAVKVGGRRAYALARAGEAVELAERDVVVHRFEQTWRSGDRAGFVIECSAGTYVRSLIAEELGGDAYCLQLRRTRIGPFDVADAGAELELGEALSFLPAAALDAPGAVAAAHGRAVAAVSVSGCTDPVHPETLTAGSEPVVRLLDPDGAVIALAEPRPDGSFKPVVGFRG